MAANQTQNYGLNQWELSDSVIMAEFNADNQKVDAALANLNKRINTAVADAEQRLNSMIEQLRAAAPHVQTGTYVGTGTYGEAHPNTLTFDFTPKLVILSDTTQIRSGALINQYITRLIAVRGSSACPTDGDYLASKPIATAHLTWGENSLSWYSTSATAQGNYEGFTYHYIAIG